MPGSKKKSREAGETAAPAEGESTSSSGAAPRKHEAADPFEPVEIMNTTFTSLSFPVPGRSVYMRPRETAEVPKAYLETKELQALVRQGAVVVVKGSKSKE